MSNNTQNKDRQFSVIVTGVGYLNRIRLITPESGEPYLACDAALKQGKNGYARFACRILGKQAIETVRKHFTSPSGEVVHPKDTVVMAYVTCGGVTPRIFEFTKGKKKGEQGVALHSAMLSIRWLKIGDDVVLQSDPGQPDAVGTASNAATVQATDGEPAYVAEMRAEYKQNGSVKLDKSHPEFEERKAFLKDQGFKWDRKAMAWVLPKNEGNGNAANTAPAAEPQKPPVQAAPVAAPEAAFWDFNGFDEDLPF